MTGLLAAVAAEETSGVSTLLLAVGLVVAALVFIFLEVLMPSFGLLTIAAVVCAIGAVALAFSVGTNAGLAFLLGTILLLPVVVYWALKLLRGTSLVTKPSSGGAAGEGEASPSYMAGTRGVTVSTLRPGGTAVIDGRKTSVVTRGEMVAADAQIEVVTCEGNRVVVRPVEG